MTASEKRDKTENDKKVSSRFDEAFPQEKEAAQAAPSSEVNALRAEIEKLNTALKETEEKVANYWDRLVRGEADHQNALRRAQEEVEKTRKFAIDRFAGELLEVLDSLEHGLSFSQNGQATVEHLIEGMTLTKSVLLNIMNKEGIKEVLPEIGEAFNPTYHEALTMQESSEFEPNRVLVVIQKGYMLHNRLLRPARVVVSKAPIAK